MSKAIRDILGLAWCKVSSSFGLRKNKYGCKLAHMPAYKTLTWQIIFWYKLFYVVVA